MVVNVSPWLFEDRLIAIVCAQKYSIYLGPFCIDPEKMSSKLYLVTKDLQVRSQPSLPSTNMNFMHY